MLMIFLIDWNCPLYPINVILSISGTWGSLVVFDVLIIPNNQTHNRQEIPFTEFFCSGPLANARPVNPHIILAIPRDVAASMIFSHKMPQSIRAGAYCAGSIGTTIMQGEP
jgi:hypothetical protein